MQLKRFVVREIMGHPNDCCWSGVLLVAGNVIYETKSWWKSWSQFAVLGFRL